MTIEMEYANVLQSFNLDYAILKEEFLRITRPHIEGTSNILNDLKNHYSQVINSARVSNYINNLDGLLRILEKRNELAHNNIKPLIYIESNYVRNPVLEERLKNYQECINVRPAVPLFNIYSLPGGKYNVENENSAGHTRLVALESLNNTVRYCPNREQRMTQEISSKNKSLEFSEIVQSRAEDTLLNDTENGTHNDGANIDRQISYANFSIRFEKSRQKIPSYAMTLTISLFCATVFTIVLIIACDSWSSASSTYTAQTGFSGYNANDTASRERQIQARMSLHSATETTLRLRPRGSVGINSAEQSYNEIGDAEIVRIVFLELSDKLGRHWRDVARFLGVTEHDIDEIDYQSQLLLKEKAFKALMKFHSRSDRLQWKSQLKRALEKARRRDLMEMVENLLREYR